ncbi:methyltransferase [Aureimonas sp. SA4125]|uniref:SAM-dependent methyltransferase n=1 Tax=Aureimonas sp. SA4125 TaxID=2826993 RepID=UPI001CC5665B|nr:SAM-dependent methyltransferase [Aureimonas sp. SA4125]BDA83291.1 methyltransferase [Aureimonas sp. SA4125]
MKAIGPEGFEAMFRADVDPWNYRASRFEAFKRKVLLRACGDRPYGRTLELACANGETTLALAPRSLRLLALDSSPTVITEAERRTAHLDGVETAVAVLPREMPKGTFDLIVVSEILYYLGLRDCRVLLRSLANATRGRIVIVHHVRDFGDAAQKPFRAQADARRFLRARMSEVFHERHGRFEALAFDAHRSRGASR